MLVTRASTPKSFKKRLHFSGLRKDVGISRTKCHGNPVSAFQQKACDFGKASCDACAYFCNEARIAGLIPTHDDQQIPRGWAREVTVNDFAISKEIAGVNMRLTAGGICELHWHQAAEWAIMTYGLCRITHLDAKGRFYVADVKEGDLWYFPPSAPHSLQGLGPDSYEFVICFDDSKADEFNTLLVSDWFAYTPPEVLAKNFGVPAETFVSEQPIAVVITTSFEAVHALVRTESFSADVVPDEAKSSTTDSTELRCDVSSLQGAIKRSHLLWALSKSGSFRSLLRLRWSVREPSKPR